MNTASHQSHRFRTALFWNFIWVNLSEVWRYFAIIRPMLQNEYSDSMEVAPITPAIFASWMIWDTILILSGTAFYWLFLKDQGASIRNAVLSSLAFTITIFGLIWLGIVNMGFVSTDFILAAVPLAWMEQLGAALIVWWFARTTQHQS